MTRRTARWLVILAAVVALLAMLLPAAREFLAVDRCLDRGGAYDYETGRCRTTDTEAPEAPTS